MFIEFFREREFHFFEAIVILLVNFKVADLAVGALDLLVQTNLGVVIEVLPFELG